MPGVTKHPDTQQSVAAPSTELHIERVAVKDLVAFADDMARRTPPDQALPIVPFRARAQAQNPDAHPDDIALTVGFVGAECVSFIGTFPGRLRCGEHLEPVRWISAWWASPAHRGRGLGKAVLQDAAAQPHALLGAGSSSEQAERAFRHFGCAELAPMPWDNTVLQKPLPSRISVGLRRRLGLRPYRPYRPPAVLRVRRPAGDGALALNQCGALGGVAAAFQWQHTPDVHFFRSPAVINWMVSHPWNSEDPADSCPNYYFSSTAPLFRYAIYEACEEPTGSYAGFVVFQVVGGSDGGLCVHLVDYCFARDGDALAARAVLDFARRIGAVILRTPWYVTEHLTDLLPPGSRSRRRVRRCFWWPGATGSPLAEFADQLPLRHVDGDTPFI